MARHTLRCPICANSTELSEQNDSLDGKSFLCNRCGKFTIPRSLEAAIQNFLAPEGNSAKISHAIRQANNNNQVVALDTPLIEEILKRPLPSPSEQADILVRWLGEHQADPGKEISLSEEMGVATIGALSREGFNWVLKYLTAQELIEKKSRGVHSTVDPSIELSLTFAGWQYFNELKKSASSYRKAFMAMKFGDEALNWMLDNVFRPSVEQTGFCLYKLDDEPRAGLIDDRLRVEIQSSDFLIADLTHDNLGAYWEAGYAEGLGKPVIYTCEREKFETERTHFDTNHHLTILWEENKSEPTFEQLKATIRATLPLVAKMTD